MDPFCSTEEVPKHQQTAKNRTTKCVDLDGDEDRGERDHVDTSLTQRVYVVCFFTQPSN